MRNWLITFLCFLSLHLGFVTMLLGNEVIILHENDNGKEIRVKEGTIIELSLEELGAAGFNWQLDQLDERHFELMKTETKSFEEKAEKAKRARVGGPVLKTWWLKAKKTGESQLSLAYFRPWEGKAKAVKHFQVAVHIQ